MGPAALDAYRHGNRQVLIALVITYVWACGTWCTTRICALKLLWATGPTVTAARSTKDAAILQATRILNDFSGGRDPVDHDVEGASMLATMTSPLLVNTRAPGPYCGALSTSIPAIRLPIRPISAAITKNGSANHTRRPPVRLLYPRRRSLCASSRSAPRSAARRWWLSHGPHFTQRTRAEHRLHEACSYRTYLVAMIELADEQGVRLREAGEVGIALNNHIDRLADLEVAIPRFTASAFAVSTSRPSVGAALAC